MSKRRTFHPVLSKFVGVRIKALRTARGWTQARLGHETNLEGTSISRIERAEQGCSIESLCTIALALEVSPSQFLPRTQVGLRALVRCEAGAPSGDAPADLRYVPGAGWGLLIDWNDGYKEEEDQGRKSGGACEAPGSSGEEATGEDSRESGEDREEPIGPDPVPRAPE